MRKHDSLSRGIFPRLRESRYAYGVFKNDVAW